MTGRSDRAGPAGSFRGARVGRRWRLDTCATVSAGDRTQERTWADGHFARQVRRPAQPRQREQGLALAGLRGDPLPWLLHPDTPAVRHMALRELVGRSSVDAEAADARAMAMSTDPIAAILAAQHPDGYWEKPGPATPRSTAERCGSSSSSTSLALIRTDARIQARLRLRPCSQPGCRLAGSGRLAGLGTAPPPPSAVIHCLNGNLLRALIGFGWIEDRGVQGAIDWEARAITGEGMERWYATGTCGPGFACAANEKAPCAWGARQSPPRAGAHSPADARTPLSSEPSKLGPPSC